MKWRVLLGELRKGLKVKTSSEPFQAGPHDFVLDVCVDGWDQDDKEYCACYVRYVGRKKVLARASIAVANGPTWRAEDDTLFAPVADVTARTRAGTKRFVRREKLDAICDAAGYLTFSATVDVSEATLKKNGQVRLAPASAGVVELMTEDEIAAELEKVEREEIAGAADQKTNVNKAALGTQLYRNAKFTAGVVPIVMRYMKLRGKVSKMRKKVKHVDREAYYDERTTMWDEEHEKAAAEIRKLFSKMGGLYNKLAQDWATRDGLLPQAWVDELKGSFEAMPPRPWPVMKKSLLEGLEGEGVPPVRGDLSGLDRYFKHVDEKPLAAASIGQVHLANAHGSGDRLVVKAIYPEIRRYLVADLANARRAAQQITKLMDIPVKGTIDSIMDEQVDSFPRELDLRIEARHLRKSRLFFHRHGIASKIAIPVVVDELSVDRDDPAVKAKAVQAVVDIAMGIGMTMFRERFFHSDPHPGNIMLLGDACKPGLIDFGQCTGLTKEQLRTVCHVVILLRTRSPSLIDKALAMGDGDFEFNTDDPELKMALMYYFFDSSTTGSGAVRPEAMEFLKDAIQHNPAIIRAAQESEIPNFKGSDLGHFPLAIMPVLTDTPREMIFYGRVCGTLRKSFELLDADVSVISLWYLEAKKALRAINHAAAPDNVSSALLLLPDDPDGLVYIVERLPTWTTNAIKAASSFGDRIADLAGETAASRAVPEAFVAADVQHIVGLQRKLFAASVLLAGVYLFAEPLVRGFAALVGAACFGALFAPPKKDAVAPPSF
ncbi:hypothetical protein JL722_8954 [Aureococcus anophagefferens]|nr:hypothetical protein JL722_8954 [Aureococcus anophagefferens]